MLDKNTYVMFLFCNNHMEFTKMFVNSLKDNKNDNDKIGIKMVTFLERIFFFLFSNLTNK